MLENIANFINTNDSDQVIKVIGIGGGGCNAVNHMYQQGIHDVDFIICNTDAQALDTSPVPTKVQLGAHLTEGRGAGNKPEKGREAAVENIEDVKKALKKNTKMVFITAGMGGGTGTGGAPVVAQACSEMELLTVGIVTIPFKNEGRKRINQAFKGIQELQQHVDALLVIDNERIREIYGDFSISEAFSRADNVLSTAAKGIAEIITVPGYINVDFADVRTVMKNSGLALMGTGIAEGENRAEMAVKSALNSPLLNNNDIRGAKDILLNITSCDEEATMSEVGYITDYLQNMAGFDADIIWGNGKDEKLGNNISVTIIATGFGDTDIDTILNKPKSSRRSYTLGDENSNQPSVESKPTSTKQNDLFTTQNEIETATKPKVERKNSNYNSYSDEELDELENIPAYKRRQMRMNNSEYQKKAEKSKYSVTKDNKLFDKNSYLHNKPD